MNTGVVIVILLIILEQALQWWSGVTKKGIYHPISRTSVLIRLVVALAFAVVWMPYVQKKAWTALLLSAGV